MHNHSVWDSTYSYTTRAFSKSVISLGSRGSRFTFSRIINYGFDYDNYKIIPPKSDGSYEITGQGVKLSDTTTDCRHYNLKCKNPLEADKECSECLYGHLIRENGLWVYTPEANPSMEIYYAPQPLIHLHPILRGAYNSESASAPISNSQYLSLFEIHHDTSETLYEYITRNIANWSFKEICKSREGCISSNLDSKTNIDLIYYGAITFLHTHNVNEYWINTFKSIFKSLIADTDSHVSSRSLLGAYADLIVTYNMSLLCIQSKNKYNSSKLTSKEYSRPVYSRLPEVYKPDDQTDVLYTLNLATRVSLDLEPQPGTRIINGNAGYKYLPRQITDYKLRETLGLAPLSYEQLTTHRDPESWIKIDVSQEIDVSNYILSGIDAELYRAKQKIDLFYYEILNPDTCYVKALDWIAGILGLTSMGWDYSWSVEIKRAIIKNCLGWHNNEDHGVRSEFPYSDYEDYFDTTDNYLSYDFSSIEPQVFTRTNSVVTVTPTTNLKINKKYFEGLYPTRGTFIQLLWWNMLFHLERFDATSALEIYDAPTQTYKLKSTVQSLSELNIPVKFSLATIGKAACDITQVFDTPTTLVCLPFKYNRDGSMWRTLELIYKHWMPINHKPHIQYATFTLGYSTAGDTFLSS